MYDCCNWSFKSTLKDCSYAPALININKKYSRQVCKTGWCSPLTEVGPRVLMRQYHALGLWSFSAILQPCSSRNPKPPSSISNSGEKYQHQIQIPVWTLPFIIIYKIKFMGSNLFGARERDMTPTSCSQYSIMFSNKLL